MSINALNVGTPTPLRHVAEARLKAGTPPPSIGSWTTGMDALAVLHNLAGSPTSASDALKLLHELQVHQVELTLQHEQLEQSRAEIDEGLNHYVERFDFAPVGYFTVEPDGRVIEGNLAAADLFALERAELPGRPIESLIDAGHRGALRAMLDRLRPGGPSERCEVHAGVGGSGPRRLQAVAKASPRARLYYVTFTDISP